MFNKGDIVRRRNGWTPMELIDVDSDYVQTRYCGSADVMEDELLSSKRLVLITDVTEIEKCSDWRQRLDARQYIKLQNQLSSKGKTKMSKELYQTIEATPRFGTKLAVNSKGQLVLEMKGTGDVESFDPASVEVVMPYTVSVMFSTNPTEIYNYLAKEGDVEVGDILLVGGDFNSIALVTALNTKSSMATAQLSGVKLVTKKIG